MNPKTEASCDWCRGHKYITNAYDGEKWIGTDLRICSVCSATGIMECSEAHYEGDLCTGNVQTLSGTYCEYHRNERNARLERGRVAAAPYLSDSPPDWYDYLNAGEYWGEDDY